MLRGGMAPDTTTLTGTGTWADEEHGSLGTVLALRILWLRGATRRVGEVAFLGPGRHVVGRGDGPDRVRFLRQRPGGATLAEPLASRRLSREQLLLQVTDDLVRVERTGRAPLRVDGVAAESARLTEGALVEVPNILLLELCRVPRRLDGATGAPHPFGQADDFGIVGETPRSWRLRADLGFAARRAGHVLILGHSGTGKELAARSVHTRSTRAEGPFVARSAATLPPTLIDAELFGHAADYPSAGMPARPGLVGAADGGTLFLDELAELPPAGQTHLLRVLDGGEFHRLGEARTRTADLRVVAATNRSPDELREDLLGRFALRLTLPTLTERRGDIPLLFLHLLRQAADPELQARFHDDRGEPRVATELLVQLVRHEYTRHVRELEQLLWESALASQGRHLEPLASLVQERPVVAATGDPEDLTKERVEAALEAAGSVAAAARELGLSSRFVLYRLMKRHGLR